MHYALINTLIRKLHIWNVCSIQGDNDFCGEGKGYTWLCFTGCWVASKRIGRQSPVVYSLEPWRDNLSYKNVTNAVNSICFVTKKWTILGRVFLHDVTKIVANSCRSCTSVHSRWQCGRWPIERCETCQYIYTGNGAAPRRRARGRSDG